MPTAQDWIDRLHLQPHPEGGYFRETYRSVEVLVKSSLPARFRGDRAFSTAIYFLFRGKEYSAFHRIQQDEVWHFYDGSALTIHVLDEAGHYSVLFLGKNLAAGEQPQGVVPA